MLLEITKPLCPLARHPAELEIQNPLALALNPKPQILARAHATGSVQRFRFRGHILGPPQCSVNSFVGRKSIYYFLY